MAALKKPKKSQPRGKPFIKGDARAGRPKGVPNKATQEIRESAHAFIYDPKGFKKLLELYRAGKLHPTLVKMFFEYAHGKVKDRVEISGNQDAPLKFTLTLDTNDDRPGS